MRLAPLLVALLLVACDGLPGKPNPEDRALRPSEITDFDQLYAANCQGCHGTDGSLGAARNLNDPIFLALIGEDVLHGIIAKGISGTAMPGSSVAAGGYLTDAQIDVLSTQMLARWSDASAVAGVRLPAYSSPGDGADAKRGAQAFKIFCGACHGDTGAGGEQGGSVIDDAYLALVSDQALRSAVICGRTDLGMPDWRGLVESQTMTEQQIDDVVAFLAAQRVEYPGRSYPERGR